MSCDGQRLGEGTYMHLSNGVGVGMWMVMGMGMKWLDLASWRLSVVFCKV